MKEQARWRLSGNARTRKSVVSPERTWVKDVHAELEPAGPPYPLVEFFRSVIVSVVVVEEPAVVAECAHVGIVQVKCPESVEENRVKILLR